jgi:predicted PhzF superfamily epimerase YddE/YHI9
VALEIAAQIRDALPMSVPLFHIDAFTDRPFAGNPAAVCVLAQPRDDDWMQSVARELNLSETAFLLRSGPVWGLRWFTPSVEVDLCGHATLASAHALWEADLAPGPLAFDTRSGRLASSKKKDGSIELDFPAEPAAASPAPPAILAALNVETALWTGHNRFDFVLELADELSVRAVAPDFRALAAACGGSRGVIVTARSSRADCDFVSRYFAPAAGIDEDPVTGSAHCCLGPLWADRLGRPDLVGYQASRRGGFVSVRVLDAEAGAGGRVALGGRAITVARGELASF